MNNNCTGVNNPFYGKKHSKETKDKMSESRKNKGYGSWNIGKKRTELQKIEMSKIMTGNQYTKGHKLSQEHKDKISKGGMGRICSLASRLKMSNAHKGEKSYNWKGGITEINRKIRKSIEIRLWREAVFARDNFTCQKTGQRGGKLVAHHMHNFADFPELRTSIENGIVLSVESHRDFHKRYGKRKNTKEQLIEFLNK